MSWRITIWLDAHFVILHRRCGAAIGIRLVHRFCELEAGFLVHATGGRHMDGTQVDTLCTQPRKFRYRVSDELGADTAIAIFRQRSVVLNAADAVIRVVLEGYKSDDLIILHGDTDPIWVRLAKFARPLAPATLQAIIRGPCPWA